MTTRRAKTWPDTMDPNDRGKHFEDNVLRQCDEISRLVGRSRSLVYSAVVTLLSITAAFSGPTPVLAQERDVTVGGPTLNHHMADGNSASGGLNLAAANKQTGTKISVPIELEPLHRRGGVPDSLELLRMMEKQQQKVAALASKCTVSVRIGPAQGCGVLITDTGFIITAAHVAMRPELKATVTLSDGREVQATTLGMNRHVDAGLIRINPDQNGGRPWPHASLGTSDDLVPGMWCIAMGHPGGYKAARGAVIRVGRLLRVRPDVIVSDCALIGGDSGGPLFNMAGELIAVHSRIGNDVADNLHVPIDHYDYSWKQMAAGKAWGYLPDFKPTLGVSGSQASEDAAILDVKKASPAEAGGMKVNDVVIRFGEKKVSDFQSLKDAVADTMPGERVPILVVRGNATIKLIVEIGRSG